MVAPGVWGAVLALLVIASAGVSTATRARQPAAVVPGGQDDPAAPEVAIVTICLSPVPGLFTVTESVTVTVPPGARSPVHVSTGAAYDTCPAVAAASPS